MNLAKYISLPLLILFFAGCVGYVGGECSYNKEVGTAKVISKDGTTCLVDFYPMQEACREWNIKQPVKNIEVECPGFQPHKNYPALYSKITKGTCAPFNLTLYRVDALISSIEDKSVCLNENSLKPDKYQYNTLESIAQRYTLLSQAQKNLKLGYMVVPSSKYSDEYAFSLSILQAKKFENLMLNRLNISNLTRLDPKNHTSTCRDGEVEIRFGLKKLKDQ